jgi:hypothetical protein
MPWETRQHHSRIAADNTYPNRRDSGAVAWYWASVHAARQHRVTLTHLRSRPSSFQLPPQFGVETRDDSDKRVGKTSPTITTTTTGDTLCSRSRSVTSRISDTPWSPSQMHRAAGGTWLRPMTCAPSNSSANRSQSWGPLSAYCAAKSNFLVQDPQIVLSTRLV